MLVLLLLLANFLQEKKMEYVHTYITRKRKKRTIKFNKIWQDPQKHSDPLPSRLRTSSFCKEFYQNDMGAREKKFKHLPSPPESILRSWNGCDSGKQSALKPYLRSWNGSLFGLQEKNINLFIFYRK